VVLAHGKINGNFIKALKKIDKPYEIFDENLLRGMVYNKEKIVFIFKDGIKIEQELQAEASGVFWVLFH
jgi:hypothetical protein